ncbi:MAG: hypothetical protein EOM24_23455 [Chloroflexia bacterium]|nr:hypothetical protein [Chloroflexia bacterium]
MDVGLAPASAYHAHRTSGDGEPEILYTTSSRSERTSGETISISFHENPFGFILMRTFGLIILALSSLVLLLWLGIAVIGLQSRVALISSGLLLIGLALVLWSGLVQGWRNPSSMFGAGLVLLVIALALALPWGDLWIALQRTDSSSAGAVTGAFALPAQEPKILSVLADRTRSATELSVLDMWLIMVLMLNLIVGAQVLSRRRSAVSLLRANALAVFLLLGFGLVLSHLWS